MTVEYKIKIDNTKEMLIKEINDRVNSAIDSLNQNIPLKQVKKDVLEIDLKTLNGIQSNKRTIMHINLINKLEYILESQK